MSDQRSAAAWWTCWKQVWRFCKINEKNAKVTILPTSCKKYGTNSRNQAAVKLNGIISLLVPGKMLVHDIKGEGLCVYFPNKCLWDVCINFLVFSWHVVDSAYHWLEVACAWHDLSGRMHGLIKLHVYSCTINGQDSWTKMVRKIDRSNQIYEPWTASVLCSEGSIAHRSSSQYHSKVFHLFTLG